MRAPYSRPQTPGARISRTARSCVARSECADNARSRDRTVAATARSSATMAAEAGFPSVPCAIPSHDSSFGEFVAHPVHGEDVLGAARIRLDLPADVLDVRVDGAFEGVDVGAADCVEQLRAGEDAS